MQLAFALPWDPQGLARARALADSLLSEATPDQVTDPWLYSGLAALTGKANLAAEYARQGRAAGSIGTPPSIRGFGPALLVYAALGGPDDSLAVLERRVSTVLEETLPLSELTAARMVWLAWPATLAFPNYELAAIEDLSGDGDHLLDLQAHWAAGDSGSVRGGLDSLSVVRQQYVPASRTLDALYPEAELLVALGDLQGACDWLDPTLRTLPQVAPHNLTSPIRAASLMRAAALRARLAERLGDHAGAQRWASAVVTLWSDADPFLQPIVTEMRRVSERSER
jgi:hypothetical protein